MRVFEFPVVAIDANVIGDDYLLIVTDQNTVMRVDLATIDGIPYPKAGDGEEYSLDPSDDSTSSEYQESATTMLAEQLAVYA